ncbi:hypothetical protein CHS0354_030374 [Potamilus streckersoni]|uniref:Protein ELYS n=1 Tax=Potamilus streckersoni TaxID=2493646 RepID=A0AAE0T484_9BIVA|nr:hypothetical protein CHS0354_030374 [Potamilus streckersoni]
MRPGVLPNWISPYQSFQHQSIHFLDSDNSPAFAGFTKDGNIFWIVKGPILEVIESQSRNRLAAWKFGHVLGDQHTNITCVKEFLVDGKLHLLVGVCNVSKQGILCLFHVNSSRVVKAIEVPYQITELEPVCSVGGKHVPKWALSSHLQQFYGVVSVGTIGGHIYLLDMCLDVEDGFSDEEIPQKLHFITPRTRDIEQIRSQTVNNGQSLCIHLNEENFSRGCYQYQKPDNIVLKSYPEEKISVSCLKYIHQTGILVVGFDFGCYQLWNLHIPVLEYSSRLESNPKPITHVTYQEPENDPKNFCYLWVCRGSYEIDVEDEPDTSFVTLYQLTFNKRTMYHNYGVFYEDLASVCLRIDHELTASPVQIQSRYGGSSRVLACYTLEDPHSTTTKILDDESFDEGVHGPDLSLCLFVWEAFEGGAHGKLTHHMAIFDMNRWYHAQMPSSVRHPGGPIDTCPYFAYFSLDSTLERAAKDKLLTVYVGMKSLRKYIDKSPLPSEQFFYPASLAFNAIVVTEGGMLEVKFLGSQRQALADLVKKGPAAFHQPQDMYRLFLFLGLLPRPHEAASLMPNSNYHKEALLTVMLNQNLIGFIISCIQQWAGGEYEHHGCTLTFLLNWAWDKVSQTKQQIDNTCTCLYDWSGLMLDQRSLETLYTCYKRLNSVIIIFKALVDQSSAITEQGLSDVEEKIAVTSLISQHLQMVLWFLDARLLPENDEAEELLEGQYSYPAGTLIQAYKNRRQEAQQLDTGFAGTEILMIDGLMKHLGPAVSILWEREGGNGQYPPPSLHALLSIYLLDELSLLAKHTLVLYVLLDLVSVSSEESALFEEKINTFVKQFYIPSQLVKQIQGFWLLDHKDYEEAIGMILHPSVKSELGRWQHCLIIRALLYQGEEKLALRYSENTLASVTSAKDMKLKLTVLLANGYISLALDFLRTCQDPANSKDLMNHFFLGCLETKKMGQLLQFHLMDIEESLLVEFLLSSTDPHAQNLLVMHYLQRGRIVQAIQLNEKLKETDLMNTETETRERARTRNQIVEAYASRLPPVLKKLIFDQQHTTKVRKPQRHEVQRPTPLSTKVTKSTSQVISQATYIQMVMDSVDDDDDEQKDRQGFEDTKTDSTYIPFISNMATPSRQHLQQSDTPARIFPTVTSMSPGKPSATVLSLRKSLCRLLSPPTSVSLSSRKRKYFSADEVPLLKTPTVHRVTPVKKRLSSAKVNTPQSILKVRRLISTTSPSPHNTTPSSSELDLALKSGKSILLKTLELKTPATYQPGTPRSVSFAEPTASETPRAAVVSDTPKRLRFTGLKPSPGSSGSSPDSPGTSPWSSSSPRSIKDRSPTPESITHSPKLKSKVDDLQRRPIHPSRESERNVREDNSPASDLDKEITFNFHKSAAEDEQETSGSTATFESFEADSSVASSSNKKDDIYEIQSSPSPQQDRTSSFPREATPLQILSDPDAESSSVASSMQVSQREASEVEVDGESKDNEEDKMEIERVIETGQDQSSIVATETDFHFKEFLETVSKTLAEQLPEGTSLLTSWTSAKIRTEFEKHKTHELVDSGGTIGAGENVQSQENEFSDSGQISSVLLMESVKRERISAEPSPDREIETQIGHQQNVKKQHTPSPRQMSPTPRVHIDVKLEVDQLEVKGIIEDSGIDLLAKFVPKAKPKSLHKDESFPVVSSSPPSHRSNISREKSVESDRTEPLTPTRNRRLMSPEKVEAEKVLDETALAQVVGEPATPTQAQKVVSRAEEETSFLSTPTRSPHKSKKAENEDETPATPTRSSRRLRAKRAVDIMDDLKASSLSPSRSPKRSEGIYADSQSPISSRRVTRRTLEAERNGSKSSSRSPAKTTQASSRKGKATEEVSGLGTSKSPGRKTRDESKSSPNKSSLFRKTISPTKSPEKRKMEKDQSPPSVSGKLKKTLLSESKLPERRKKSKSMSSSRDVSGDTREETVSSRKLSWHRKQKNDSLVAMKGQDEMVQATTTPSRSRRGGTVEPEQQTSPVSSPSRILSRKGKAKEHSSQSPSPRRSTREASNRESISPSLRVQNDRSTSPSESPQRTKMSEKITLIVPKPAKSPERNIEEQTDWSDVTRTSPRSTRRRKGVIPDKTGTETPTKVTRKSRTNEESLKSTPSRRTRRKVESEETASSDDDKLSSIPPISVTPTRSTRSGKAFASVTITPTRRSGRLNKDESISQERESSESHPASPKKGKRDSSPESERKQDADVIQAKDANESIGIRTTPSRTVKKQKQEVPVKSSSSETGQDGSQPSDFVFSEPMQVEGIAVVESPARPFTTVKSFIFSPPLSSPITRSRLSLVSRAGSPLTTENATSTSVEVTPNVQMTRVQSLSLETPTSEEEVSLISPLDPGQVRLQSGRRRVTKQTAAVARAGNDSTRSNITRITLRPRRSIKTRKITKITRQ